jgi:hypothetical protein
VNYLSDFQSYLHLNTSFSDDIGLVGGKACSVLFFSSRENSYYNTDVAFDFVAEILDQVGQNTPFSYGHGVAGVGALLTYLTTSGILEADVNELVGDFDRRLLKMINAGLVTDTGLAEGLGGYGMYLLARLESGILAPDDQDSIFSCVAYIAKRLLCDVLGNFNLDDDLSLWTGIGGVYMFLSHISGRGFFSSDEELKFASLVPKIFNNLVLRSASWDHLPLYFALVNSDRGTLRSVNSDLIWSEFDEFLSKAVSHPLPGFTEAAFYAALLKYCSLRPQGYYCAEISGRLAEQVSKILNTTNLRNIYPYNFTTRNVNVGMRTGAGGAALSFNSLINNDFGWFRVLGYKIVS